MEFLLTAGITLGNAETVIKAGYPVLIPGGIVLPEMVAKREWDKIVKMSKSYVDLVRNARNSK